MDSYQLSLPKELTIVQVDEYKSSVLLEIQEKTFVTIDDSNIVKVDTVGVQFLLSLINTMISRSIKVEWGAPYSQILIESVKQLGLEDSDFKPFLFK